jgi:signal transduction histidine kinase/CheY-like chemotaxis protein
MTGAVAGIQVWETDGALRGRGRLDNQASAVDVQSVCRNAAEHVTRALDGETVSVPVDDGRRRGASVFCPLVADNGRITGAVAVVLESASDDARTVLRERLAFEELITELSTRFVTVGADAIDAELNRALGAIGEFCAVDRTYIFRFKADGRTADNTHEWCGKGIQPQIEFLQGVPVEAFPWWAKQLKARQVIHVADVDALPPEADAERELSRQQDVRSFLAIPMVTEHAVVGFVGFDAVGRKKDWLPQDIALLRIAGEIFVGAIERAHAETERQRLEAQLVQSRSLENVARLAGGVAHDFNNLLAVILNYATILQREIIDPGQREKIEELFDTARHAADITRQLLLVGRRDIVEPVLLDLTTVVRSLQKLVTRTLGESIEVRLEVADDLDVVRLGLPQVEQVIVNLTINARDAMPRGGTLIIRTENATISVEEAARNIDMYPGRYVRLLVKDDGEGMTPEVAARAFEPFFTTKGTSGTGLGLATVYGIVKQAGGIVTISSELGAGTAVEVLFPVVPDAAAHLPTESVAPPASSMAGRGETVLVVDDSAAVRKLVSMMLSENRYHPIEAATPEEAIEVCARLAGSIDLLLTDVIMPRMSGRDLAVRLRAEHGVTRVLYMSGYDDDVIVHHGVLEDGVVLLQKPFLEADLLLAVRKVLDEGARAEGLVSA